MYEYRFYYLENVKAQRFINEVQRCLDEEAKEGWRLHSQSAVRSMSFEMPILHLIFEREVVTNTKKDTEDVGTRKVELEVDPKEAESKAEAVARKAEAKAFAKELGLD